MKEEKEKQFKDLFESERFVAYYDATGKSEHEKRITVTNTFLRQIDKVFVFISGAEKKDAFRKIQEDGSLSRAPARILKEIPGNIYADESVIK